MTKEFSARDFAALTEQPVQVADLMSDLAPPIHFHHAKFSNYIPDDRYPSHSEAVQGIKAFVKDLRHTRGGFFSFFRSAEVGRGLYLDGGFGIGKTHLLAAAYHAFHGRKAYMTFQELMFLVGLQGLPKTVETLSHRQLLVIDEFELDDPANTRISTNLFGQLFRSGVSVITSSNTAPGALGEGKFSVEAFRRELGDLFTSFQTLRIEGEDYRATHHVHQPDSATWFDSDVVLPHSHGRKTLSLSFEELLNTLSLAHPIRIRKALHTFEVVRITNITTIDDPHAALRFVYFVDKAYDNNLMLYVSSAVPISELFAPSIFQGGDTKKYLRAMSRLQEITGKE